MAVTRALGVPDEREGVGSRGPRDRPGSGSRRGRERRRGRRWLRRLIAVVLAVIVAGIAGFVVLEAETPSVANAPVLVGDILADHHAPGDGGHIPARVADALLATEDSRYYHDPALDPKGTLRALWGAVTGNANEGGATIEVQLAKLLYTPDRSSLRAKIEQAVLAFKLDARYTKRQILSMYLDAAYFGDGAYGVTEAAERYFDRPADQLSWAQASLLAGLVQAPSAYSPVHHLTLALERRRHVLDRLVATHVLTAGQAAAVARAPLDPAVPFGND